MAINHNAWNDIIDSNAYFTNESQYSLDFKASLLLYLIKTVKTIKHLAILPAKNTNTWLSMFIT